MRLDPVKWTQGDYTFYIYRFPPFRAMNVLGELQRVIIPALGGLLAGGGNGVAMAAGGLASIVQNVDGATLEAAVKMLLDPELIGVSKGGKEAVKLTEEAVEEVFEGRPLDVLALCGKVFEVNFMDFSRHSSIPDGVRKVFDEIKSTFRESAARSLSDE